MKKFKEKSLNFIILSMLILLLISLSSLIGLFIVNAIINYGNLVQNKMLFYMNIKKFLIVITLFGSLLNTFCLILYIFNLTYNEKDKKTIYVIKE